MSIPILTVRVQNDHGLVVLRDRCRQIADLFGLDGLQRTRLTTAASEVGRNALRFAAGASASFSIRSDNNRSSQSVVLEIVDKGPGIPRSVWANGQVAEPVTGSGLRGSQRLVDAFALQTSTVDGTRVTLEMQLPRTRPPLTDRVIGERVQQLLRHQARSPLDELELQNHEMLETLEALRSRQIALEEADLRKNEFVAMLAHELRNPLAAISMTLTLLKKKKDLDAAALDKFHGAIGRHTEQLIKLVSDLMDASRVSRGAVVLDRNIVDLRTVVGDAVEMTDSFVVEKQHRLVTALPDEPLWVDVDLVRMKQVVSNLLHNAARYTDIGGTIEVTARRDAGQAVLLVTDSGIGIEAAMLPKVFDLFTQASQELARRDTGLGVGLTIVQRLVHDHGGSVQAHSAGLHQGSTFEIRLPLVPAPAAASAAPSTSALPSIVQQRRVLIVDDNADMAHAVAEALRLSGFVCTTADDGHAAIAMALADAPDIALVDIGLPLIDGYGVARTLRASLGSRLLLLAMTGYSSPTDRAKASEAGFDALFPKPVNFEALLDRLRVAG